MRNVTMGSLLLLVSIAAFSFTALAQEQSGAEIQKYAPYNIALLPNGPGVGPGTEVVIPFMNTENKLTFFPLSQVQQASKEKRLLGRLVSYGELIALIGDLQIEINRLNKENEKLWTAVTKSSPQQTVVVQAAPANTQQPQQNNDALMRIMLIRQLFPAAQPPQTINLNVRDCTRFPALCVGR
jgi:hypothetical protein